MKLRSALVAASVMALPVAALAQPVDGVYVGAGVGYNYLQSEKIKDAGVGSLKGAGGIIGVGSVGYGFGNGFRIELQGDYRGTHQKQNGNRAFDQTYGGFINGLFDFDAGIPYFYPYVGFGGGFEVQDFSKATLNNGTSFNDRTGGVAAQAILGASFPIPDVDGLSITAEYRFMSTITSRKFATVSAFGVPGSVKIAPEFNHAGLLGLRYAFGVAAPMAPPPAPAPVVAPAPAPARTYLVFFDWDKSDLTARARQIIAEAAQNAGRVSLTRIEVAGHADRSGTPAYNLKLSQRRANAVAAELVRLGIPQAEISTMAYGDTHPLVPTAAGVREPQNRRVEIVLK